MKKESKEAKFIERQNKREVWTLSKKAFISISDQRGSDIPVV